LIFDATRDDRLADDWCWDFADSVLSRMPSSFSLPAIDLLVWLDCAPAGGRGRTPTAAVRRPDRVRMWP
jgi:hypothetical protein